MFHEPGTATMRAVAMLYELLQLAPPPIQPHHAPNLAPQGRGEYSLIG
jgi:hypothetical protein